MTKWDWFRKYWSHINVVYAVALVSASWIVNGSFRGNASGPWLVLAAILFISLGLNGISVGNIRNGIVSADRDKNPGTFWVLIITIVALGCAMLFISISRLWRGT
jgi:hypothetical protein